MNREPSRWQAWLAGVKDSLGDELYLIILGLIFIGLFYLIYRVMLATSII